MQKNPELAKLFSDYQRDTGAIQTDAAAILTLAHCVLELRHLLSAGLKLAAGVTILNTKNDPAFQTPVNLGESNGQNQTNMDQRQEGDAQTTLPGVLRP